MKTSVFDVVHIFSERGISAVPIVDEDGIVLNMYETVDIVVSSLPFFYPTFRLTQILYPLGSRSPKRLSSTRLDNRRRLQSAFTRLYWSDDLHTKRYTFLGFDLRTRTPLSSIRYSRTRGRTRRSRWKTGEEEGKFGWNPQFERYVEILGRSRKLEGNGSSWTR
jgi:CBS domain-containing protein